MQSTTVFEFGDVVLVQFPFTDHKTTMKRPAVVVSARAYNENRPDVIILAVTSRVDAVGGYEDVTLTDWAAAGLPKPSVVKPVAATVAKSIVTKHLGRLTRADQELIGLMLGRVLSRPEFAPQSAEPTEPQP